MFQIPDPWAGEQPESKLQPLAPDVTRLGILQGKLYDVMLKINRCFGLQICNYMSRFNAMLVITLFAFYKSYYNWGNVSVHSIQSVLISWTVMHGYSVIIQLEMSREITNAVCLVCTRLYFERLEGFLVSV